MSTYNLHYGTQAYLNFQAYYHGSKPAQVAPWQITCYSEAIMCMIRLDIRIGYHLLQITTKINQDIVQLKTNWSTIDKTSGRAAEWAISQAKNVLREGRKYSKTFQQDDQLEQIRLRIHHYERLLHYLE